MSIAAPARRYASSNLTAAPCNVGRPNWGYVYDTGLDQVSAVDATSDKLRWSYTLPVNLLAGPQPEPAEPVSRGVTYGAGRIYVITADGGYEYSLAPEGAAR